MNHAESFNPWDSDTRIGTLVLEMPHLAETPDEFEVIEDEYLTRSDVARLLGVSPNTVTRWAREGRLPSHLTLGGHHRFERSAIERIRQSLRRD